VTVFRGFPMAAYAGASFLASCLLSLYLTPIFRDAANRFGIVDRPDGRLKNQEEAVSYLGGLAVFSSMLFPVAIFLQFSDRLMGLLLASTIIVLLGLIDDIGNLSPRIKFLVQVIAVFLMIKSGIRIRVAVLPPLACVVLTFLWMILMTNGFNLIDVMDGLAAGVAVGIPAPQPVSCADLPRGCRVALPGIPPRGTCHRRRLHPPEPLRLDLRGRHLRRPVVRDRLPLLPPLPSGDVDPCRKPGPLQPSPAEVAPYDEADGGCELRGGRGVRRRGYPRDVPDACRVPGGIRGGPRGISRGRGLAEGDRHEPVGRAP